MRTAAAWIYKSHSEVLGKTFKVQDTNHRLMTGIAYRGAATCTALDYEELMYEDATRFNKCCSRIYTPQPVPLLSILDGGNEETVGTIILDGGNFDVRNPFILRGGIITNIITTLSGGLPNSSYSTIINGGLSNYISYPRIVDGGYI